MGVDIDRILGILQESLQGIKGPVVKELSQQRRDPFRVLIAAMLSSRTKDEVTEEAVRRLFKLGRTPADLAALPVEEIARAIYPVGFYRSKARNLKELCRMLVERHQGKVPQDLNELLKLKGVGRKTANLVITLGFNRPGICVDTHVHRISNRLGLIRTKTPRESEEALKERLPQRYWIRLNGLLVTLGQNICTPISPRCSLCPVEPYCQKVGVSRSR